ncbi:alpha/beta hydrolase [Zobellia galactanivorans]|uniref:alpha/beta hydrolase n=1 Tax=Zobellia galactanivorans (strain DSM 12802 / CCUG 47099 / CIP 106680 / NCIMB 13871 / Dsij) TaxID=63186 RepID=UPI001C0776F8|nr:alpha/beta hydrolase [Zobellia galactanivorans]MBU3025167.1 alpha/beta hydrolase [Zobellia galactanivorans]MDO6810586.1 alpha/beta hydrolase [Zobellia galactanivorans]
MKKLSLVFSFLIIVQLGFAQEFIELPYEESTTVKWEHQEKQYFSEIWKTEVVTNVSVPTLQVFQPKKPNGTSVIIAPGGALYAHSINSEGRDVAKWLADKGITAFVLKYRLVPTGQDAVQEYSTEGKTDPSRITERIAAVFPLSIADGLSAVSYVRENAKKYQLDPNKIGFMGFSAGGAVTMGVAYNYKEKDRPDFIVPVYAWTSAYPVQEAPENAPDMLVICASDDSLGLAPGSIEIYNSWIKAGQRPELHMYAKGGHGFGLKKQGLPADHWIQRFYEWSVAQGITSTSN